MANIQRTSTGTGVGERDPICRATTESYNTYEVPFRNREDCDNTGRLRAGLTRTQVTRFWSKVQRGPSCLEWQAGRFHRGYGQFNAGRFHNGTQDTRYTHRVAYQLCRGDIPSGLVVMHTCDNPPCCNPAHLVLGTQGANLLDAEQKGRLSRRAERPALQTLAGGGDTRRKLIAEALSGPRGTIARLAREYRISPQSLYQAVQRARQRQVPTHGELR